MSETNKNEKKKNYQYSCINCGYNFDDDDMLASTECPECGKDMITYQQVFRKCPICRKDIMPDENDSDGAYISDKVGVVTVNQVLHGYYTDVNHIDVDDWDNFIDFYHLKCLNEIIDKKEKEEKEIARLKEHSCLFHVYDSCSSSTSKIKQGQESMEKIEKIKKIVERAIDHGDREMWCSMVRDLIEINAILVPRVNGIKERDGKGEEKEENNDATM